jgi:riboflavin biosynthesis pyrimidine reductase
VPLLVVVSNRGGLPADALALRGDQQQVLIATTAAGAVQARADLGERSGVSYYISPGDRVDLAALLAELRERYGIQSMLSEGGAAIYGSLIAASLIDEVFLTISPIVIGSPPGRSPRPSLVEGIGFSPDSPPQLGLVSLRRVGDYLFQRARYRSSY